MNSMVYLAVFLAELAFLLTIIPSSIPAASEAALALAAENPDISYLATIPSGFVLPMGNLGSAGMFCRHYCSLLCRRSISLYPKEWL